jgi:hypothetical protein
MMEDIPIVVVAEFGNLPESEESSTKSVRTMEEHGFHAGKFGHATSSRAHIVE